MNELFNTGYEEAKGSTYSRRDFLKSSGLAGAGLLIGMHFISSSAKAEGITAVADTKVFEPNVYLKIGSDGKIILFSKNPEIGQGIKTSLPQILAEELEVDWKTIEVQQAVLDTRYGAQFAGGSTGIKSNFDAVRKAAASAREMLIEAASRRWQCSLDKCFAKEGFVYNKTTEARLSYAELAEAASKLNVRENPPLKNRKDYKIIGQPIAGVDNPLIVTGKVEFGLDARPKGTLVASIERCPVFGGRIKSIDDAAALKITGVEKVVRIDPTTNPTMIVAGVAVVARNTWAAFKGRRALKIEWDLTGVELDSDATLKEKFEKSLQAKGEVLRDDGNVDELFALW